MEPCGRLLLSFPVYGMSILPDGSVAVTGGGGRMKSGIPNACETHSFNESTRIFSKTGSISLPDAPTALATHKNVLVAIVGTGCKNFLYKNQKLSEESDYEHDIKVSSSEEQSAIAFSRDGTRLILASDEGPVRVLGYPECEELAIVKLHTEGVNDIDVSSDGLTVASSARDKCTHLWHTDTGVAIQNLKPVFKDQFKTCIRAVRFNPTDPDSLFAVESNSRKGGTWISSWRKSGNGKSPWQNVAHYHALAEAASTFAVSSNGRLMAVSSVEGHVALLSWNGSSFNRIWNTETGTGWFRSGKPSHALPVTALRFSHSNEYLLTASADWTVAVWPAYKPWNFKPLRRWIKRLTWLFVLLLAYILAEHKFPPHVEQHRMDIMPPSLNPYISDFQRTARPVLIQGAEEVRSAAVKNILPHLEPHVERFERDAMPILRQRVHEARAVFDDVLPRLQTHVSTLQRRAQSVAREFVRKARSIRNRKVKSVDDARDATYTHSAKKATPLSNDLSPSALPIDITSANGAHTSKANGNRIRDGSSEEDGNVHDLRGGVTEPKLTGVAEELDIPEVSLPGTKDGTGKPDHISKEMSSAPPTDEEAPVSLETKYENMKVEEKGETEAPREVSDPFNEVADVGSIQNIEGSNSMLEPRAPISKKGGGQDENYEGTTISEAYEQFQEPVIAEHENVVKPASSVPDYASATKDDVDRQKRERSEERARADGAGTVAEENSSEGQAVSDHGSEQAPEAKKSDPRIATKEKHEKTELAAEREDWTEETVTSPASSLLRNLKKSQQENTDITGTTYKSVNTIGTESAKLSDDISPQVHVAEEEYSEHTESAPGRSVEEQGDLTEGTSRNEAGTNAGKLSDEERSGASADQIIALETHGNGFEKGSEYCQPRRPWEQPVAKVISFNK